MNNDKKPVAAIVTEYRRWSHADVIIGKILEGFNYDGGEGPRLKVVSMYVDQFPEKDMAKDLAKKYGFTIYDSIDKAVTNGGDKLAVAGVLSIGEHGKYENNPVDQKLYPRRRFFEETCKVFEKSKRAVPFFNDKHLAATWADAKWMYDRARELYVPFMAGSSVPVTFRKPDLKLPMKCDIVDTVAVGYGPFEGYGFHAIEGMQCMLERRRGGETGVKSVQCVQGEEMWKALDEGRWSKELLEVALERVPAKAKGEYRKPTSKSKEAGVFLIEYVDGLKAAVAMMNGYVYEGDGGAFTFACRLKGQPDIQSCLFYLQQPDPFIHFAYQLKAIDSMIQTGHAVYPVERTLLTTGILDAVMNSRHQGGKKLDTPHLAIKYTPTDWPYATDPVPKPIKR